jgi:hypothetical protein
MDMVFLRPDMGSEVNIIPDTPGNTICCTTTERHSAQHLKNYDNNNPSKYIITVQEPKTKAGKRDIPLPPLILEELKEYKNKK